MGENNAFFEWFEADPRNQSIAGNCFFFMGVGDGLEIQGRLVFLFENAVSHPLPVKVCRAGMGIVGGGVGCLGPAENQTDDIVWMPLVIGCLFIRRDYIIGRCGDLRTVGNFFRIIEDSLQGQDGCHGFVFLSFLSTRMPNRIQYYKRPCQFKNNPMAAFFGSVGPGQKANLRVDKPSTKRISSAFLCWCL